MSSTDRIAGLSGSSCRFPLLRNDYIQDIDSTVDLESDSQSSPGARKIMSGHFYFEIHVDDINRAVDFYRKVFGWRFEKASGLPVEYLRIDTGGTRGGLLKRPAKTPPPGAGVNAFVASVEVDHYDKAAQSITHSGGQIALPKFAVPGVCWQGYFVDTEGNTFGIFQVDEKAGI